MLSSIVACYFFLVTVSSTPNHCPQVRLFGVPSCPIAKSLTKNIEGIFCVGVCLILSVLSVIGVILA